MMKSFFFSCILLFCSFLYGLEPTIKWHEPEKQATISFTIPIDKDDAIYKEYIDFSCDTDAVALTGWTTDTDAISLYDPTFKESKLVYETDVTFSIELHVQQPTEDTNLRFTYYRKSQGCIQETHMHIPLITVAATSPTSIISAIEAQEAEIKMQPEPLATQAETPTTTSSWYCTISDTIKQTNAWWLQLLFIYLLGVLLSFTPCIYPMIPITVGILQGQGATSFGRNLFLSLCYTTGIATTFALLGMFAAYSGSLFGTFMQHPAVILAIVSLLVYLAGSMFGFYEMYVPKSLTNSNTFNKGGSPVSAFLFGAVSGTVASPCISPGLVLVLSIVTGLANSLLGFAYLFVFGVGLSTPLLIIGTFSGSLNLLPTAGMWMVEIKKLFGFFMLAMCIYFTSMIIPPFITAWLWTLLVAIAGLYYAYAAKKRDSLSGRCMYNLLGILLISTSVMCGYYAVRATAHPQDCTIVGLWADNYGCGLEQARHENKRLLVKIEAACCTLCTAINKKFFTKPEIQATLDTHYIPVRIDGGDTTNPDAQRVVKQFSVIGFPTLLIIDPTNETIVQKWEGELYEYTVEQFGQSLLKHK